MSVEYKYSIKRYHFTEARMISYHLIISFWLEFFDYIIQQEQRWAKLIHILQYDHNIIIQGKIFVYRKQKPLDLTKIYSDLAEFERRLRFAQYFDNDENQEKVDEIKEYWRKPLEKAILPKNIRKVAGRLYRRIKDLKYGIQNGQSNIAI